MAFVVQNPLAGRSKCLLNYSYGRDINRSSRNKKKEPTSVKKRRMLRFFKDAQRRKKMESKVNRRYSLWDKENRTSLSSLHAGMELEGKVISLTSFGAYVDVNTECDGLLHISQMSVDEFIEDPKQLLQPGNDVNVTVYRVSSELKKLQLSMSPTRVYEKECDDLSNLIELESLRVDDEIWGEIVRVTDYGAYVEFGGTVQGFLHFMDNPAFSYREGEVHPSELMTVGQRVRVWVLRLDFELNRVQLTAFRPKSLFVLKRERRR